MYPTARFPDISFLISVDDANLACKVTIANANDFATMSTKVTRRVEARVTNGNVWKKDRQPVSQERRQSAPQCVVDCVPEENFGLPQLSISRSEGQECPRSAPRSAQEDVPEGSP